MNANTGYQEEAAVTTCATISASTATSIEQRTLNLTACLQIDVSASTPLSTNPTRTAAAGIDDPERTLSNSSGATSATAAALSRNTKEG